MRAARDEAWRESFLRAEAGRVGFDLSLAVVEAEGGGVAEDDERLTTADEDRARFAAGILAAFVSVLSERVSGSVSG